MKHCVLLVFLLVLATPAFAQVFQPVPAPTTSEFGENLGRPLTLTLQGADFQWTHTTAPGIGFVQVSPVVEIDAPLSKRLNVGGWLAEDRQKMTGDHLDSSWANGYVSYLAITRGATAYGITAGYLGAHLEDTTSSDNGSWAQIGLVASVSLARRREGRNVPELGLNICEDRHLNNDEGNAVSYGASLALPVSNLWSANLSAWQLAVHTASTITIAAAGIGYRL